VKRETARALIEHVRRTIEAAASRRRVPALDCQDPEVRELRGAFVTLKKNGELRGCIGHIMADAPLAEVISEMALAAAFQDPRFGPVSPAEVSKLSIEISVLTPFTPVADISEIEVGKHGLMLSMGYRSGLLLPQVPGEWGWDRDEFLHHLCGKAGLPSGSHLDPRAKLMRFEAEVWSEEDLAEQPQTCP